MDFDSPSMQLQTAQVTASTLLEQCTDPAMLRVVNLVKDVKNCDGILLTGETGTGKEIVARALHECGDRSSKPFIVGDCTRFSSGVAESELFGHERGAFTGAANQRIGYFESAHGGTLVLDEIGEIPLEHQARLLRALDSKLFCRVGGTNPIHSDFRLIASTNRSLPEMVRKGQLREDLFYRLNVIPIEIPPLRKRTKDIPRLARHFTHDLSNGGKTIEDTALKKLLNHPWPGNVRELQNVIKRATMLSNGNPTIGPKDLVFTKTHQPATLGKAARNWSQAEVTSEAERCIEELLGIFKLHPLPPESRLVKLLERMMIERALKMHRGQALGAGAFLGINRHTLRKKMHGKT